MLVRFVGLRRNASADRSRRLPYELPPRTLHRGLTLLLALIASALTVSAGAVETEPLQSQAQFEAAIRNTSTSPNFILLTVVDDRTGESTTGCTLAPFLLEALGFEHPTASSDEIVRMALSNESHVFRLSNEKALNNLSFKKDPRFQGACLSVKSGRCVRMGD